MQEVNFCPFSHSLADVFEELATLSGIFQKNDLIFPQTVSELRKTVTALEVMQESPTRGGMLSQFLDSLQGQERDQVIFQVC